MGKGPLIILSGPSGSGKSTLIRRLLAGTRLPVRLSVSATTRARRSGEVDGVDYHFCSREQFEAEIGAGAFLEWALVHGNYYGTPRREVEPFREKGIGVILDIDVQGADQVRKACLDHVSVFLRTSSMRSYEERLRKRNTENEDAIQRRLATAQQELARAGEYRYQVINDDLGQAVAEFEAIIRQEFERGEHAG